MEGVPRKQGALVAERFFHKSRPFNQGAVLEIISLGLEHQVAIADYVAEFAGAGETGIPGYFGKPDWSHAKTVEKLNAWSRGEDLEGWVPNTTRFLLANGRILGNFNFRHELTDELMRHGGNCGYSVRPWERRKGYATLMLGHAKDFGRSLELKRMLVTCDENNIGSARAIEKNGGVFQDLVFHEQLETQVARYWITL